MDQCQIGLTHFDRAARRSRVKLEDLDGQPDVSLQQRGQGGGDETTDGRREGGNANDTGGLARIQGPNPRRAAFECGEDRRCLIDEVPRGRGQHHTTPGRRQQPGSELRLKPTDLLRDSGG